MNIETIVHPYAIVVARERRDTIGYVVGTYTGASCDYIQVNVVPPCVVQRISPFVGCPRTHNGSYYGVWVAETVRGQQLGTTLFQVLTETIKKVVGVRVVTYECHSTPQSLSFYLRLGGPIVPNTGDRRSGQIVRLRM